MIGNLYVYGGSFNPPHKGHLKVVETLCVQAKNEDDQIVVLPSFRSPLKEFDYEPEPSMRLNLTNVAFDKFPKVKVDPYEMNLSETAYTIDTLKYLQGAYEAKNTFIVIGFDQLTQFHKWKDFKNILAQANLAVLPRDEMDFSCWDIINEEILDLVESEQEKSLVLKSGKKIEFLDMELISLSSSEIRRKALRGDSVSEMMSPEVVSYLDEHQLYRPIRGTVEDYLAFSKQCKAIIEEKNAVRVELYDVREINQPSDFNMIASGLNTRHTKALAEYFVKEVKKKWGIHPIGVEGLSEGRWVVVDYGALIVHVFYDFVRSEYSLEELWKKGKLIP